MARRINKKRVRAALLILPVWAMVGCLDYTVETTLDANGGGVRSVRIEAQDAEDLADLGLSPQDVRSLLGVSEGRGWSYEQEIESDGDTAHIFRRKRVVTELGSWRELNDDVRIAGALPSKADSSLGYLTLGEVRFRNRTLVGTSRMSDGSASFSYRETFFWENGVDAIVEYLVSRFDQTLRVAYPDLPAQSLGEVLGSARASLWTAVEAGVLDASGDEEDLLWSAAVDRTSDQAIRVVRRWYPSADEQSLRRRLDVFSDESEEALIEGISETLPGLNLAVNTAITFRLSMPGRVTNTNAHEQDGNILTWEFGPTDALTAPVVLLAESVVGG